MLDKIYSPSQSAKTDGTTTGYRVVYDGYTATGTVKPPVPTSGSSVMRPVSPSPTNITGSTNKTN